MEKMESIIEPTDTDHSKESLFNNMAYKNLSEKVPWYYGPAFLLVWIALFFAVIIPAFNYLPDGLSMYDVPYHQGQFIAEYAQRILYKFDRIGPKVVGSSANENETVKLVLDEIANIRQVMNTDLYEMEVDLQQPSGAFMYWTMINMYQGVQNIVVKLRTKHSTSESYLLVNSHFDSKPASPSTGDDGFMVVVMLETLRQIAISEQPFEHPIVFLFNGAEENALEASHGFITQHKWAKNCKALINLDAAGSGKRELLFQSGPKHPWLMKYYGRNVKHPFATTIAEEIFQAGLLPSDTDFRNFRDYGHVPGLDLAQNSNGYVYHTKFDSYDVIPRASIQSTGDNILAIVRGLANASELSDTEKYEEGHVVFFDFLGIFFVYYTEATAIIVNCTVAVVALALVLISLWRIAAASHISIGSTTICFAVIFVVHLTGFVLAFALPLLIAVLLDAANRSMSWFTHTWLNIGLYVCPSLLGLCLPTVLYYTFTEKHKTAQAYRLQMTLHAHGVILALLCIILTAMELRSTYLIMIPLFFYTISTILNLVTTLHDRKYYWTIPHKLLQIFPFLYTCYIIHSLLTSIIPMTGRNGSVTNPDLFVAILCALGSVFAMGFLIPLVNIFRRPKSIVAILAFVTVVFLVIAATPLGYPYRPRTNVGRVNFLHARRIFYEYDGSVSLNESGYLFDFQDRHKERILAGTKLDLSSFQSIASDCKKYMMCGMPLFNHRWTKARMQCGWIPRSVPVQLPGTPKLTLLSRTIDTNTHSIRYEFNMTGPTHMSLFIQPLDGVSIVDWTFLPQMLRDNTPPYHIYFTYGNDNAPLNFYLHLEKEAGSFDVPLFELGFSAHYVNFDYKRDAAGQQFIADFPDYVHLMEWPSSYERYIF